jgi:hypothetical protein
MEAPMAELLVRDISDEMHEAIQEFSTQHGLNPSEAAVELIRIGIAADPDLADLQSSDVLPVGDYLARTLKEVLHTQDEAEEYIRNHEDTSSPASRNPV